MFFSPVDGVVHPTAALLYTKASPLLLREHPGLGQALSEILREDHVPEQKKRRKGIKTTERPAQVV